MNKNSQKVKLEKKKTKRALRKMKVKQNDDLILYPNVDKYTSRDEFYSLFLLHISPTIMPYVI